MLHKLCNYIRCQSSGLAQAVDGGRVCCFPVYPQPSQNPTCPNVEPGSAGICIHGCSSDSDCTNGQKCCSNGCGRTCTQPDLVPYYNVSTQQCPDTTGLVGICEVGCRGDYDCRSGQMCCRNGCGQTCASSVTISQRCSHVRAQFNATGRPLLGAYVPQCDSDGHYSPVQCHEGFCWCAHTQTGLPLSSFYGRGERPRCTSE